MGPGTWESFHNAAAGNTSVDADQVGELRIIEAAIRDRAAFAPLYFAYAPRVYGYCLRRLADPDRAADATSHIFTRVLHALPRFRPDPANPGATFRAWLFTIAHHTVMDLHRRHRPHASLDALAPDGTSVASRVHDPSPSPEALAVARDEAERFRAMLAVLPDRQRQVIELRLVDLTGVEIAQILGISLSAVKSAQARAYATLRDQFPGETA